MKRLLISLAGCGLLMLTGCSELQVIRNATLRELRAEAISVDSIVQDKGVAQDDILVVPELRPAKRVVMAKAEYNPYLAGSRKGTTTPRKALWGGQ